MDMLREAEAKERAMADKSRVAAETKAVELLEEKNSYRQELDHYRKQCETINESKMALEKEAILLRAKLESMQGSQEELERLRRQQIVMFDENAKHRTEYAELNAANKELVFQKERYKEEVGRIQAELEAERKSLAEYRLRNEKQLNELRTASDEQRDEYRQRIESLQEELRRKSREREEMKQKCKTYASIVDRLRAKMRSLDTRMAELQQQEDDKVPLKLYKQLKKQYKLLKHSQRPPFPATTGHPLTLASHPTR